MRPITVLVTGCTLHNFIDKDQLVTAEQTANQPNMVNVYRTDSEDRSFN